MSIPGSLGPVWPVLNCVLKEGAKRKDDTQKTVVVAVRSLAAVLCVDVCQLLQPAVNEMAEDVCRVCHIHLPYSSSQTLSLSRSTPTALFHRPVKTGQTHVLWFHREAIPRCRLFCE